MIIIKNLVNKVYKLKRGSAIFIGTLAMIIGIASTSMCFGASFYEPEMPKSLYMDEE